jgi:hypothetical protein
MATILPYQSKRLCNSVRECATALAALAHLPLQMQYLYFNSLPLINTETPACMRVVRTVSNGYNIDNGGGAGTPTQEKVHPPDNVILVML